MICENQWEGCYNDSWMGDIVPESFAHPAKYSRGLIHLIYQHAKEMGWVKAWDVVIDPFGGVALGGLDAMGMGLHWIGVELEEKFVSLGEQNIELWNRQLRGWHTLGTAKIIQGDSRKIKDVIEKADLICISPPLANMKEGDIDIVVSSPPFLGMQGTGSGELEARKGRTDIIGKYGDESPGNLANMKEGDIDCVISSPPFASTLGSDINLKYDRRPDGKSFGAGKAMLNDYGSTPGNLANMKEGDIDCVISSPPYEEMPIEQTHMTSNKRGDPNNPNYRPSWKKKLSEGYADTKRPYGKTDGQLGSMKESSVDAVISSPPYGNPRTTTPEYDDKYDLRRPVGKKWGRESFRGRYTEDIKNQEQLGNLDAQKDTFWEASLEIVRGCYELLKPGGHAIWVCKDYIKAGKRVPFSQNWASLCESIGFEIVCWHQAMLVKEHGVQITLEGKEDIIKTERMSFFRRLHGQKYPHLKILWEDIICMVKGGN